MKLLKTAKWLSSIDAGAEDVALIAADELTSLLETAHLLRPPANAERLLTTLARVQGRTVAP
jgi:antitoxin YefM